MRTLALDWRGLGREYTHDVAELADSVRRSNWASAAEREALAEAIASLSGHTHPDHLAIYVDDSVPTEADAERGARRMKDTIACLKREAAEVANRHLQGGNFFGGSASTTCLLWSKAKEKTFWDADAFGLRSAPEVLAEASELSDGSGLVFPGARPGRPLSENMHAKLLRELGFDAVTHGFRSSFRDYVAERTHAPHAVMEAALAQAEENRTRQVPSHLARRA